MAWKGRGQIWKIEVISFVVGETAAADLVEDVSEEVDDVEEFVRERGSGGKKGWWDLVKRKKRTDTMRGGICCRLGGRIYGGEWGIGEERRRWEWRRESVGLPSAKHRRPLPPPTCLASFAGIGGFSPEFSPSSTTVGFFFFFKCLMII
ncbi:hypothetical protein TIFTF001_011380 [Ficus carica]|uniref:Uncharacterized protein n=1 Tax=Ficus carica TaxID=3494 RepID=A0AA88ADZ9_FICCA|nr:hypothetical protein TIFTF001_011380 [Ficus carica]